MSFRWQHHSSVLVFALDCIVIIQSGLYLEASAETMCHSPEKPTVCVHPGGRPPVWDSTGHRHPGGSHLTAGVLDG